MHLSADEMDARGVYRLLTSILVPRPVAWVSTVGEQGGNNLAPFSYFMGVSSRPPLVAISVARGRKGALKDTARNLLRQGECCISVVSADQLEQMHASSAGYPAGVSEFDAVGVESEPCHGVAALRVKTSAAAMECRVHEAHDYGSVHLFVLRVLHFHVRDDAMVDGRADPGRLAPVARLGGGYALLGESRTLPPARVE